MKKNKNLYTLIISLIAVLITIFIVIYSEHAFQAALEGLKIWWEVVFPSLLPFFIIAEILMGLGVVHFLGTLLEPLMKPLFKVPGVGAFALAMGLASGYPIGAKITANLRKNNLCTKTEGERLLCFTNTADPLFLVGAVSVGMLHSPKLGLIIALSHYISSLAIGFIMRFYKRREKNNITKNFKKHYHKNILKRAYDELIEARKSDGRSLGELFGDSVKESINTLLMVGGFIIIFSVITELINVIGITTLLTKSLALFFSKINLSTDTITPLISGFFEITNGANLASQIQAPLIEKLIIINAVIAWSGLSVHSQV
ncbi:MAG: sporulation integral membrane protein YlbJ, partial [Bacillota bacterium]